MEADIEGRHVLLVDTIIDTGRTIAAAVRMLSARKPSILNAVVLIGKSCHRLVNVPIAYR